MGKPTLLLPVTFPDPAIYPLEDVTVDSLNGFDVVLLGYWELSDGESRAAVRADHETEAEAALYDIAAALSHGGASTDIELHFGEGDQERRAFQRYIVEEFDPDGVLLAERLPSLRNVLVPLRDDRHVDSVTGFLGGFDPEGLFVVELYHAVTDDEGVAAGEAMLDGVADRLLSGGFSETDLERTVAVVDDVPTALAEKARNHNIAVMGATDQQGREDRLFGAVSDHLSQRTDTPVLVVR